ncbi:MAG TPA: hypothetical protein VHU18_14905 [Rhizomicrobium sp.]|nr:hypothetical protein [Rhizomicrobium sp.]
MPITELHHVSVRERAVEIGCPVPEIAIMPENFAVARSVRELRVRRDGVALRSVLEGASFSLGSFCSDAEHATFGEEDFVHWDATLFISGNLLAREPYAVGVALSIIRGHLAEYFNAQADRSIRLSLVVECKQDGSCRKVTYEGDIGGLHGLAQSAVKIAGR